MGTLTPIHDGYAMQLNASGDLAAVRGKMTLAKRELPGCQFRTNAVYAYGC
jgi:hypothetical protein